MLLLVGALFSHMFCSSLSTRTRLSRRKLVLPNESCSPEMNGYRILKPCSKMPTVGLPCRTRSLKPSFRLSRTDWIKREVRYINIDESDPPQSRDLNFSLAQKGAVPSPLSFAGRIAKPLRGGGGGVVPRATTLSETTASTIVPANPLAKVQNEERYAFVCIGVSVSAYLMSFLCEVEVSCQDAVLYRPRRHHILTHGILQASALHGSSSLGEPLYPFCFSIIPDVSCTLLPPYIISTDSYTLIPPYMCTQWIWKQFRNRSMLSGHSAGLNFFFFLGVQPQTARLSLSHGP